MTQNSTQDDWDDLDLTKRGPAKMDLTESGPTEDDPANNDLSEEGPTEEDLERKSPGEIIVHDLDSIENKLDDLHVKFRDFYVCRKKDHEMQFKYPDADYHGEVGWYIMEFGRDFMEEFSNVRRQLAEAIRAFEKEYIQ